jgi:hypothetical protein
MRTLGGIHSLLVVKSVSSTSDLESKYRSIRNCHSVAFGIGAEDEITRSRVYSRL